MSTSNTSSAESYLPKSLTGAGRNASPLASSSPPAEAGLVFAEIVGVQIDMKSRDAPVTKLEDIAEAPARCGAPCPRGSAHAPGGEALDRDAITARDEHQRRLIVSDPFEDAFETFHHVEDRRPPTTDAELREVEGRVFMEELHQARVSRIGKSEVVFCDCNFLLVRQ